MRLPLAAARARHRRSFIKAVTWRVLGTLDTFAWSLIITHKPVSAGQIAGTETFTKVALFYVHERLWQHVGWNRDGRSRALLKAFSWRVVGSFDTFVLSMIFTGKLKYAVSIAGGEALTKIVLYYAHERVWHRLSWGRKDLEAHADGVVDPAPVAAGPAFVDPSVRVAGPPAP